MEKHEQELTEQERRDVYDAVCDAAAHWRMAGQHEHAGELNRICAKLDYLGWARRRP